MHQQAFQHAVRRTLLEELATGPEKSSLTHEASGAFQSLSRFWRWLGPSRETRFGAPSCPNKARIRRRWLGAMVLPSNRAAIVSTSRAKPDARSADSFIRDRS